MSADKPQAEKPVRPLKPLPQSNAGTTYTHCYDCNGTGFAEKSGEEEQCEMCQGSGAVNK